MGLAGREPGPGSITTGPEGQKRKVSNMKKIISGKIYDTDKAKYLGVDSYSNPSDFHYWCEELYQKRTGEFFLYGKGGPMSRYAERIEQNGWSGGEQIIPLTYDKAREWAEEHLRVEYYEEIFGEVSEDAEDVYLHLKVSAATDAKLRRIAGEQGISITAALEEIIENA